GDLRAPDQFHDEVGAARVSRPTVEHLGDVGMIHQGQCLAFGFEAGNDRLGVHAEPNDLEGDPAAHRLRLFRHIDDTATALADYLEELVPANTLANLFARRRAVEKRGQLVFGFQNAAGIAVNSEQIFDTLAQLVVVAASAFQENLPLVR